MTIKEIAQLAGVSISTVSKIMNHKDASISAETRERVLQIVKEFNYTPYSGAVHIHTKTFILGLLIRSPITNQLLNGILETARSLGYTILISQSCGDLTSELKCITALCRHKADGVLWEPVGQDSLSFASHLEAADIPYLLFHSNDLPGAFNINFEQMAYEAGQSFVKARHTDLACLLSEGTRAESVLDGYRRCLFESGIPFQESMVFHDITEVLLHKITTHSVTGVLSSHYAAALRLYGALSERHFRIPDDVSLISLRGDEREAADFPKISSITIPHFQFGSWLCRKLITKVENKQQELSPFMTECRLNHQLTVSIPFTRHAQKLAVAGSINIDNYLKVDQLPTTGRAIITSVSSLYPGGKAINQAIGAAKLGANVALIGNVGNDVDSDIIYSSLKEHSIDSAGVRRCIDCATGKAYIFVQRDGDSIISILSGANSQLSPKDIQRNERAFESCSYCLVQTEIPLETVLAICKTAHKYKVKTILKPSACSALPPELLNYVDIIVPNYDEVRALCPEDSLDKQADYFLNRGIETVIITLGPDGCFAKGENWQCRFPAANFQSIDNTGAGDAFICALAVYLQYGYELKQAIRIATYAAGFSVTREGVVPSLIDRNTLEAYIGQKEPELLRKSGTKDY